MVKGEDARNAEDVSQDEALLANIQAGDSAAFEMLYDRYGGAVYGLALRMVDTTEIAQDIVQETFLRVWRRSATFQAGQGQVISWLLGITHHLCIDELRRQGRDSKRTPRDGQEVMYDLPADTLPIDEEIWLRERRKAIQEALSQLPMEQRHAIELAYFGGLSQRAIAEQTLQPLGTIKTRMRLGLTKLKEILARGGITIDS